MTGADVSLNRTRPAPRSRLATVLAVASMVMGAALVLIHLFGTPVVEARYPVAHFEGTVVANGFHAECFTADALGAVQTASCRAVAIRVTASDSPAVAVGSTRTVVGHGDQQLGVTIASSTETSGWLAAMRACFVLGVLALAGGGIALSVNRQPNQDDESLHPDDQP